MGGPGGPPQMPLVIEVVKDSWHWSKWVLGIVGTVIAGVIVARFRAK